MQSTQKPRTAQKENKLHPKNQTHKDRLLSSSHWLCMEKAKYYTDSYRETEGEDPNIRAAEALKKTFENMTVKILPEELLVGNRSSKHIAPPIAPEKGDLTLLLKYILPELQDFGYNISDEDKEILFEEIIPYWEGKTIREEKLEKFEENNLSSELNLSISEIIRKVKSFGGLSLIESILEDHESEKSRIDLFKDILSLLPRFRGIQKGMDSLKGRIRCTDTQAHIVVGHKNVLEHGFKGIKEKAEGRLKSAETEDEKNFLKSIKIICHAMRYFSKRFSKLAREKAEDEKDEKRRNELLKIAEICEKVPWNPPQSFHEAIQTLWFTQNAAIISYGAGSGITPGRVDQLLYPYYKEDIEKGKITDDEVMRLLEEFIIKINNNVVIWPNLLGVNLNHLGTDIENITIGGMDRNGEDATNELSYLFINAIENTKLATSASFRFSEKTSQEFIDRVLKIHNRTNGPALYKDETIIKAMMRDGYSKKDARDYCVVGCIEPSGSGDTFGPTGGVKIYLPTALDLVLNRGKTSFFGSQATVDTGDPTDFESFEEFMEAYYTQLKHMVDYVAEAANLRDEIYTERFPNPLISCTIDGCIENAKDMTNWGAKYNFEAIGGGGLGTVVDSLAAIKKFVYDEEIIEMEELKEAIENNFDNNERLHQFLKNGPKFGNDKDYVDAIAVNVADKFCEMVSSKKLPEGGKFTASISSYGLNIYEGKLEPATPNGRKASEPISNGISPSNGAEQKGPTAALNSLSKIDHTKFGYGNALNMRFPSNLLKSEKGLRSLRNLILTYFDKGGMHVQFNATGSETLKDAQKNPKKYKDLIVRVSGYSAYFTRLGKEIQDDIIERVEFCNM